ncbi:MAG TPA: DUF1656 domain-containing protein [Albitalea sp.]|uniref:DUF1656 domain-containing protein n=1 Tax=Piscinibacter sp. TaxID=1903157 RepID=UPI002ED3B849
MTSDINLFGVFINVGLALAVVAALAMQPLRKLLARTGAYKLTWHPALVDVCLFVLLWAGLSQVTAALEPHLLVLLG